MLSRVTILEHGDWDRSSPLDLEKNIANIPADLLRIDEWGVTLRLRKVPGTARFVLVDTTTGERFVGLNKVSEVLSFYTVLCLNFD